MLPRCANCDDKPSQAEHSQIRWVAGIGGKPGIILDSDGLNDYKMSNRATTGTCKVCGCWETLEGGRVVGGTNFTKTVAE